MMMGIEPGLDMCKASALHTILQFMAAFLIKESHLPFMLYLPMYIYFSFEFGLTLYSIKYFFYSLIFRGLAMAQCLPFKYEAVSLVTGATLLAQ